VADTEYVVLKQGDEEAVAKALAEGKRVWVEIGAETAANGNDAIVAATEGFGEEEKGGTYAAPAQRNFPVVPRNRTTKIVDEFGQASTVGTRQRRSPAATAGGGGSDD
jgi:hypothetical protein